MFRKSSSAELKKKDLYSGTRGFLDMLVFFTGLMLG